MINPIADLNKIFDSRIRLGIMSALMVNDEVNFNDLKELLDIMSKDQISTPEKLNQLKTELGNHYANNPAFRKCRSMGQLLKRHLKQTLQKNLLLIPKIQSRFED